MNRVLLIGSGVIGSVYAAQFRKVGCSVSVLHYSKRDDRLASDGLTVYNRVTKDTVRASVSVVRSAGEAQYDIVLVAVSANALVGTAEMLRALRGDPLVVYFGNNPDGRTVLPSGVVGTTLLAFPGIGGAIEGDIVQYTPVDQQPTALESSSHPMRAYIRKVLTDNHFPVQDINDMEGWLKYHAVFIACISQAIVLHEGQPAKLGADALAMREMCRAITEGFALLKRQQVGGAPKNLLLLHSRWLQPIAIRYWTKIMIQPKGEEYFGAHARHAPEEIRQLAGWVLRRTEGATHVDDLQDLLARAVDLKN